MNKLIITSIIILFSIQPAWSQSDSLAHIEFKSDFEKKVFSNLDNADGVDLLLAITQEMTFDKAKKVKSRISNFKKELESKKFQSKSEEKKMKLLFGLTHKNFFERYKEVSNFNRIFEVKEYNCVSATALYSVIMEEYNIPYKIKEAPSHVYSIAYPETKGILLESTAPVNGYYSPSRNEIQKAIASLVAQKYITQQEVDTKGAQRIFNDFFYSEENIDFQKLSGLQYYNESLTHLRDKKYKQSLNTVYKAEVLYPSEKIEYLKFVLLNQLLEDATFNTQDDIVMLTAYANLENGDHSNVVNSYRKIMLKRLFEKSDMQYTDSAYKYLSENLADKKLLEEISEIHYLGYGDFYYQKSDLKTALEFSAKAFEINNKNINTQSLISQTIIRMFSLTSGSISDLKKMDAYKIRFPFLEDNSHYQSLYFFSYSSIAYHHLRADDLRAGLKYLEQMESVIAKFGDKVKVNENMYGMVYAEAGALYFRKRNYSKAKEIIKKGLKIMPDHPELKIRLKIVVGEY